MKPTKRNLAHYYKHYFKPITIYGGALYSNDMFSGDLASQIRQREKALANFKDLSKIAIVFSTCLGIIGVFWQGRDGPSLLLISLGVGCAISFTILMELAKSSHNKWINEKLSELDLEWHTGTEDELEDLLIEIEKSRGKLMKKETIGDSGGQIYRTRGKDEKGPDWGRSDSALSGKMPRRDGIKGSKQYENLEGPLTKNEKLVYEFDLRNASAAQERWERAEGDDLDIIEAGVENLGELLKSGFFEKNPNPEKDCTDAEIPDEQ